jgi:ribosomal protein L7/L12
VDGDSVQQLVPEGGAAVDLIVYNLLGWVIGLTVVFLVARAAAVASRLERKLDVLLRHSGVDLERLAVEEATALNRAGKKIEAIKAYRELTGCGLAEAKAKVESLP